MAGRRDDGVEDLGKPETLRERLTSLVALDFEVATRAAVAVGAPLIVLLVIGRVDWVAYATFGAMTALYGRSEPYRVRLRTVSVGGLGMLVAIAFGIVMSVTAANLLAMTVGLIAVIVAGILLASIVGLFPSTPIFFVFAYLVCAQSPTPTDEAWLRLLVGVVAALFAWALTMSGWLLRRVAGAHRAELFKELPRRSSVRAAAWRDGTVWLAIAQNIVGVLIAGGLAMLVGIGHPYWAVVSVVAVIPPPGAAHSTSRAVHRIIGTALGVIVTAVILLPGPPLGVLIAVIVVGQFGAEILVGRHYGAALLFITPLALTVSHLATPVPVSDLLVDRAVETALGGGIAIVLVLIARLVAHRLRVDGSARGAARS